MSSIEKKGKKEKEKINNNNGVVLVFLSFTLNIFHACSSVSIDNFKHVIARWDKGLTIFPKSHS